MGNKRENAYTSYEDVIDFDLAREARRQKRKEKLEKKRPVEKDAIALRRQAKRRRFVLVCTAVVLFVAAMVASSGINLWKLNKEKEEAQAQLNALILEEAALKNELSQIESQEYIEQAARAELHMILPGETMYVIPLQGITEPQEGTEEESDAKPE
jgi:cell division protein FtsB